MRVTILFVTVSMVLTAQAQPAPKPQAPNPAKDVVPVPSSKAFPMNAEQTRRQLALVMREYPPSLDNVLRLDPTLLTNQQYLALYPRLSEFLAEHPEVAHNPAFFIGDATFREPESEAYRVWEKASEGVFVFAVMLSFMGLFTWLLKTAIDYRRWVRVSRVQEEVHSKLLGRMTSNEDLLAYIQTPAGKRFLESEPIPLESGRQQLSAPVGRILWSVQMGLVLVFGGFGLYYAFSRLEVSQATQPFFVISILGIALGIGFIVSAAVAYAFSQRLGLFNNPTATRSGGTSTNVLT